MAISLHRTFGLILILRIVASAALRASGHWARCRANFLPFQNMKHERDWSRHQRLGYRMVMSPHPEHLEAEEDARSLRTPRHRVILIRHGESEWNASNRFIGWADPPLTERGICEAAAAAVALAEHGLDDQIDLVLCSALKRSIKTAWLIADGVGRPWLPVTSDWRLNEQMYGVLTGRCKRDMVREHGAELVMNWRRSYATAPPPAEGVVGYFPVGDPKYAALTEDDIPESWCGSAQTESLKDTQARAWGMWRERVAPALRAGKTVAIVAHGNVIRALLKRLDSIPVDRLKDVSIPRAVPLVYDLDENLEPVPNAHSLGALSGRFLGNPIRLAAALRAETPEAQLGAEGWVLASLPPGPPPPPEAPPAPPAAAATTSGAWE